MSSCIEIYCLHLLNSAAADYLECLRNYCPDAVVSVVRKRQVRAEQPTSLAGLDQGEIEGQFFACPAERRGGRRYCVGFVCRDVSSGTDSLGVTTTKNTRPPTAKDVAMHPP